MKRKLPCERIGNEKIMSDVFEAAAGGHPLFDLGKR